MYNNYTYLPLGTPISWGVNVGELPLKTVFGMCPVSTQCYFV